MQYPPVRQIPACARRSSGEHAGSANNGQSGLNRLYYGMQAAFCKVKKTNPGITFLYEKRGAAFKRCLFRDYVNQSDT
jgi:hypothetical protein